MTDVLICLIFLVLMLITLGIAIVKFGSFRLVVKPGRKILWQDENKNLGIDVSVGFYNPGRSAGSVEEITLNFIQEEKQSLCHPELVYRFGDEGKLVPDGFWGPFLLNGYRQREQIIGFKTNISASSLPDGEYDVTLNVRYQKNLRRGKTEEVSLSFPVSFQRRDVLRNKLHRQTKKQPFFPFDPAILQGLFTPRSGE